MVDNYDWFPADFERSSWVYYGIGMVFILLRLYGRARKLGGARNYQTDDYLQLVAAFFYTLLLISLNVVLKHGGSNLYPPELEGTFTADEIADRIEGSKIVLVSEQAMLNLIYVLKVCLLILYTRLTLGLAVQRMVRWLGIYVAVGWVATQITMFSACRPFKNYWAMPPPDPQCTTYEHYAILQAFFNISSDMLMLLVPLPLVFRMNVVWKQKIILTFIFSLGICVIIAALLTKIFNLGSPYSPTYMMWYVREASVAVYVANLPLFWPLLREWFPVLRSLKTAGVMPSPSGPERTPHKDLPHVSSMGGSRALVTPMTGKRDTFDGFGIWLHPGDLELQKPPRTLRPSSSQEYILRQEGERDSPTRGEAEKETEKETGKEGKRRSSHSEIIFRDKESKEQHMRRQTMDLDLERGLYSCFADEQLGGDVGRLAPRPPK
ncbi:hypothetical protein EsH8_II_001199 [Colletotrichum jinshuiense]